MERKPKFVKLHSSLLTRSETPTTIFRVQFMVSPGANRFDLIASSVKLSIKQRIKSLIIEQSCFLQANDSNDWSEVDVTASKLDNEDWYGKADLLNLHPNTQCMVKVSSMNTEGYSQFSDVQLFTTPEKGNGIFIST